jgi:hypothetical protein
LLARAGQEAICWVWLLLSIEQPEERQQAKDAQLQCRPSLFARGKRMGDACSIGTAAAVPVDRLASIHTKV